MLNDILVVKYYSTWLIYELNVLLVKFIKNYCKMIITNIFIISLILILVIIFYLQFIIT